jgi:HEAT repeat protein
MEENPMPRKPTRSASVKKFTSPPTKAAAPSKAPATPAVVSKSVTPAPTTPAVAPAAIPAEQLKSPVVSCNTEEMEPTVSVQNLIQALRDANADVARDAAIELGSTKDRSAVQPLIEVIANTDGYYHNVVRAAAAESLGRLGDVRAVEPLLVLSRDTMAEASAEAVRALALLNDQRAVSPLIDIVRNDYGFFLPIVRRAAVIALAKLGGAAAAAELKAVSSNTDEDPVIRQAATTAIA